MDFEDSTGITPFYLKNPKLLPNLSIVTSEELLNPCPKGDQGPRVVAAVW
jgi:hypothetical protein